MDGTPKNKCRMIQLRTVTSWIGSIIEKIDKVAIHLIDWFNVSNTYHND
jgi:hypothetical protein